MMFGPVATSMPQIILLGNWLLEMNFVAKWNRLKKNPYFWLVLSVFVMHVVGVFYSEDKKAAGDDLWIKMPLFFLPLIFFSSDPLNEKEWKGFLKGFVWGTALSLTWCLLYSFVLHPHEEVRKTSRFMSHIRLGLYVNLAVVTAVWLTLRASNVGQRLVWAAFVFYLVLCLFLLGLAGGLALLTLLLAGALMWLVFRQKLWIKLVSLTVLALTLYGLLRYVVNIKNEQLVPKSEAINKPVPFNQQGRGLIHFDTLGQTENGYYVLMNIQMEDLRREWNKRAGADTFNYALPYNLKRYEILLRYLASKGLPRDSVGVAALEDQDIVNIQQNISNYRFPEWSFLHKRVIELVNEYADYESRSHVNGHSFTMRLYFAEAALEVIKTSPLIGVGTGDVQTSLNRVYSSAASPLSPEWYKRPHNQFLSIAVAFGWLGLMVFLLSLVLPAWLLRRSLPAVYLPFLVIFVWSCCFEDTLDTQAGLSFFAVFNTLCVSGAAFKKKQIPEG